MKVTAATFATTDSALTALTTSFCVDFLGMVKESKKLEAENKNDLIKLEKLASLLQGNIYHLSSIQRKKIHVAAVFVNNFTNHMYAIAHDICEDHGVPFNILQPLIQETSQKIKNLTPKQAQTGPAKRNDTETIENHLNLLSETQQELYLKINLWPQKELFLGME